MAVAVGSFLGKARTRNGKCHFGYKDTPLQGLSTAWQHFSARVIKKEETSPLKALKNLKFKREN